MQATENRTGQEKTLPSLIRLGRVSPDRSHGDTNAPYIDVVHAHSCQQLWSGAAMQSQDDQRTAKLRDAAYTL